MSPYCGEPGKWAHFVLVGPPRTKKTHSRIVRSRTRPRLLPSLAFVEWNSSAQMQLAHLRVAAPDDAFPFTVPVNVRALFFRDRDVGDACNFYQGLADALQEGGIVENDALIRAWDGSRLLVDRNNPMIIVRIEVIPNRGKNWKHEVVQQ